MALKLVHYAEYLHAIYCQAACVYHCSQVSLFRQLTHLGPQVYDMFYFAAAVTDYLTETFLDRFTEGL